MKVLVTGGTGYLGLHTCIELLNNGYSVVIVDNLTNSNLNVVKKIKKITGKSIEFYKVDVRDYESLNQIFSEHKFDAVIHFAGLKSVSESIEKPLNYYHNNILSTITLLQVCQKYNVNKFVFSSSATVYGENKSPLKEDMELLPTTNPYAETKKISERILTDFQSLNQNSL